MGAVLVTDHTDLLDAIAVAIAALSTDDHEQRRHAGSVLASAVQSADWATADALTEALSAVNAYDLAAETGRRTPAMVALMRLDSAVTP